MSDPSETRPPRPTDLSQLAAVETTDCPLAQRTGTRSGRTRGILAGSSDLDESAHWRPRAGVDSRLETGRRGARGAPGRASAPHVGECAAAASESLSTRGCGAAGAPAATVVSGGVVPCRRLRRTSRHGCNWPKPGWTNSRIRTATSLWRRPKRSRSATVTRQATVHCDHCGGDLTRSHVARYERALTFFTNRRPYRCIDCKRRRWREPLRSTVQQ